MIKKWITRSGALFIIFFLWVLIPTTTEGLSCAENNTRKFLEQGGVVFIGTVVSDTETNIPSRDTLVSQEFDTKVHRLVFDIEYAWTDFFNQKVQDTMFTAYDTVHTKKGTEQGVGNTEVNLGDVWGFTKKFDVNATYVVFAKKSPLDGRMHVDIGGCSPSKILKNSEEKNEQKEIITTQTRNSGYVPVGISVIDKSKIGSIEDRIQFLLNEITLLQEVIFKKTFVIPTEKENCINLEHNLYVGVRDDNTDGSVSRLQTFLKESGLYNGYIGGYFGPLTEQAVKDWQKMNEVTESTGFVDHGIVDSRTREMMRCSEDVQESFVPLNDVDVLGDFSQEQHYALVKIGNALNKTKKFIAVTEKIMEINTGYTKGQYVCDVEIINTTSNTEDDIAQGYIELRQAEETLRTLSTFDVNVRNNDRTTLSTVLGLSTLGTRIPSNAYTEYKANELEQLNRMCYKAYDGTLMAIRPMMIPTQTRGEKTQTILTPDVLTNFISELNSSVALYTSLLSNINTTLATGCNGQEFIEQKMKWYATGAQQAKKELIERYIPSIQVMVYLLEDDLNQSTLLQARNVFESVKNTPRASTQYAQALKYRVDTLSALCTL